MAKTPSHWGGVESNTGHPHPWGLMDTNFWPVNLRWQDVGLKLTVFFLKKKPSLFFLQGCPSWKWFYPYHYAPFASDFRDLGSLPNSFERGTQPVTESQFNVIQLYTRLLAFHLSLIYVKFVLPVKIWGEKIMWLTNFSCGTRHHRSPLAPFLHVLLRRECYTCYSCRNFEENKRQLAV